MPRPHSRFLNKLLNSDDFDPVELLDLRLVGQDPSNIIHVTNGGQNVLYLGNNYVPLPMTRGQVSEKVASNSGEVPTVTMTVTNINRQMAKLLSQNTVEGAEATLYLTDRRVLNKATIQPLDLITLTVGEVRDLQLTDSVLTFQIVHPLGQHERVMVPRRIYQANCNYVFGTKPHCGVNISASPITIRTTALAGSTAKYLVVPTSVLSEAGTPADPNDFWANGYIWMLDGPTGLQDRPIQRFDIANDNTHRFYLRFPLQSAPNPGDPVLIRRICGKTVAACQTHQGNVLQFGGFRDVPPVRFKPTEKFMEP